MEKHITIGYCRTSHVSQNIDRQTEELRKHCDRLVVETESTRNERPKLDEMLNKLWENDVVMVTELSRFGRNAKELQDNITRIRDQGAFFVSLKERIDTRDKDIMTDLLISVLGSVYQFQRDLQQQLQTEGIRRAKEKGKYKGKPEKYNRDHPKVQLAFTMYKRGDSIGDILKTTDLSRGTLYKNINRYGIEREIDSKIS